jgi:leader peptidase (prepilin peptidase) / N-methyltransferase
MIVVMETFVIYMALVLVGLCMGSFAGAMVWRLRAKQLVSDKANHEPYDKSEYNRLKKLTTTNTAQDHSRCLHCEYRLRWYDLVPLISWVSLGGKCRNCRTPIGWFEPVIEVSVAVFFVVSYAFWPYSIDTVTDIARIGIWLAAGVGLAILFAYDAKWFLLPDSISFTVIGLGAVNAALIVTQSTDIVMTLVSIVGSVVILSGLYLTLYLLSRGQWIGFGDIKLGLGLALLLADWRLAFVALFAANLIGCLIVLPAMALHKLKRDSHVPFGPLLIAGAIVAQLVGLYLTETYLFLAV